MKRVIFLSILFVLLDGDIAHPQARPSYTCFKTLVSPIIDGKADEMAWNQAASAIMVDVSDLNGKRLHAQPTEVRMLWDDEKLYVLFLATDPDIWSVLDKRDDPLWNEEVVELYIDPDGDGENYVEIEVNPLNTIVDLLLSKPGRLGGTAYFEWSPVYETAVHLEGTANDPSDEDQYWSVEIALPWAVLDSSLLDIAGEQSLPPRPGDEWRFNFYRYERCRVDTEETEVEYSAWSPVGEIDFHRPDRFGSVVFAPFPTAVEEASWAQVKISIR